MRKLFASFFVLFVGLLVGCSEDEATPNDRFETYVNHWNEQEFDSMYKMLHSDAADTYSTEEYVDRYNKIYGDLNVSKLNVEFDKLSEEAIDTAMDEGKVTIPFHVSMETIAGPISFDYKANLIQQGEDENKNWYIAWNPGFIFPEMKNGGEISIQSTAPARGEIRDRNNMPLAMNDTIYEIGIIPEKLGENSEQNKKKIAELLGTSVEAIDEKLNASWVEPNLFVPIAKIPKTEEALWNKLVEINGITRQESTGRIYPGGEAVGSLVGYIGQITAEELKEQEPGEYAASDVIGKRGLEELYEDRLRGKKGNKIVVSKDGKETVLAETEVKDGENVKLTIDINVQEKIYQTLDGDMASATVLDPKTGETLGLVSSPSFDPNEILYGTTPNLWQKLEDDERNPLLNRFYSTYAPGSVMKPITAAIGLKNGSIDPEEGLKINGLTWSNGEGWGEYEVTRVSESNGPVDLHDALVRSDNIYFAMQAVHMGSEAYVTGLKDFGIGEDIPYEYPITASTISSSGNLDDEVLLANTSYGQGEIEMSSLHLAAAYTTFINSGDMIKPTFLADEEKSQIWKEDLLTSEQAKRISSDLRDVVENGTAASYADEANFDLSGKTGTAELKLTTEGEGEENGWFVGYPTKEQDILISMMIEETKERSGSGHTTKKAIEILNKLKD
ncbi:MULTISPECIES: penicillin-binding transpeptidase domain-containing protein [Virgibacillus]|uniref:serine-type D-Ala-D-Ala carboxypeptidase n=2 Tax=Virgibacillus TaxID=84406 RepID=A0A024Q948_9BACI|nr:MULTISPECIES: penicillin-binding transpeptidase domain-containing protein [Virgibacillus]EQB37504.1 hypothetical protein M948_02865 [Virgibacillus sp. CM-4]MYL40254.1 penicillin-binding transpeptidase domain-containing protein [Virgibacillus massiliensis]GGJ60463.1 penicillin-binding protein 3 [Virgibacillus kapii]CDQ38979.1 Beta-lactam-inducible penicillin-binding protein [Virgibacillus massiliensis]